MIFESHHNEETDKNPYEYSTSGNAFAFSPG
jgi:hypothetical protein